MSIRQNLTYGLELANEKRRSRLDEAVERSLRLAALWDEVKDRLKRPRHRPLWWPAAAPVPGACPCQPAESYPARLNPLRSRSHLHRQGWKLLCRNSKRTTRLSLSRIPSSRLPAWRILPLSFYRGKWWNRLQVPTSLRVRQKKTNRRLYRRPLWLIKLHLWITIEVPYE